MNHYIKIHYIKTVFLSTVMSFSVQAEFSSRKYVFKDQILFNRSFVINPEVENWMNVFFTEFFKKELSNLEIRFSEETDMSFGFIEGKVSSDLSSLQTAAASQVAGDFVFYVNPADGKQLEYGFHLETEFKIKPTDSFFHFIEKDVLSCEGENDSLFFSFCEIFKIENFNSDTNKAAYVTQNLYDWKEGLITKLFQIEDPEITAIQPRFVNWIADQIVIKESSESVTLEIDLSALKSEFEDEAKNFFRETELTDYSFESIKLEFFEDEIVIYLHLKKLHVAKRARLYVELASLLQDLIEDEERGIGLAQSLREALNNNSLNGSELIGHIKGTELVNLGWTAGNSLIRGDVESEENSPVDSELEEELGLD